MTSRHESPPACGDRSTFDERRRQRTVRAAERGARQFVGALVRGTRNQPHCIRVRVRRRHFAGGPQGMQPGAAPVYGCSR